MASDRLAKAMSSSGIIARLPTVRGASSRYFHRTSRDETAVKDARSPQNAGAFWLPRAPLRGAFGVLDRCFSGRSGRLSSMRRTVITEDQMTPLQQHPHAAFDRFPQLVRDLIDEFGSDEIGGVIERFVDAEQADFYWDGRLAEMPLGEYFDAFDDDEEPGQSVAVLGYFRNRYYVATCVADGAHCVRAMLRVRHFDDLAEAESAFLASG